MTDYGNSLIQEFSLDESQALTQRPLDLEIAIEKDSRPVGIVPCGDGTQDYIVSLSRKHQLIRISGVDGKRVWTVGAQGNGIDKFNCPEGVVVLPNGRIAIADDDNKRLQILNIRTGRFIKQIR